MQADVTYRAIESTNASACRLAYLTAMSSVLGPATTNQQVLLARMVRWSQEHKHHLDEYWSQTGRITHTRRDSVGMCYLDLANKIGITGVVSCAYRRTRIGHTLYVLTKNKKENNPFVLTDAERLFYTYLLLEKDADVLLTVLAHLQEHPSTSLADLQRVYQQDFINRLAGKERVVENEHVRRQLIDRRTVIETTWKKQTGYIRHIVLPRLHWLLDLGFLEPVAFSRHQCYLTEAGSRFLGGLPTISESLRDVSASWLMGDFWPQAAMHLLAIQNGREWNSLDEGERLAVGTTRLEEAFGIFQRPAIPVAPLSQVLFYMTTKLILQDRILVSFADLTRWLSRPRTFDGQCYHTRLSPHENTSYIIQTPAQES